MATSESTSPAAADASKTPSVCNVQQDSAESGSIAASAADCLTADSPDGKAISKADAKRLRKEQRRMASKANRQEKKKQQKQRKKEERQNLLNSMSAEERDKFIEAERAKGRLRKAEWDATLNHAYEFGRPRVIINCSFTDTMAEREVVSLAKQIQMTYTYIRNSGSKVQLHLTSYGTTNKVARSLEAQGMKSWKIHTHEKTYWDVFQSEAAQDKLVVLTPDAEEDLEQVSEDEIYVIGGIVDRSVNKLQSLQQAESMGATKCRKLPLKRFGPSGCCPVLNIDCVVRILCEWIQKNGDWTQVFEDCLPGRCLGDRPLLSKKQRRLNRRMARMEHDEEGEEQGSEGESESTSGDSSELKPEPSDSKTASTGLDT
eukprot:TRINITY_DN20617_c0_g1_i1.p1 TRINITY_DN20617_c0_g1~~TRINITY_DN20617_c0_g1_i1.p1  ORF type:complete len:373 (-),score=79.24 TRINITY_DN20617_c0_g1_i1:194-1312(-)